MKRESRRWAGSVTVEACILMPICLILLMTMLFFAMFVYEKAATRAVCNQIAAEGAAVWQRGAEYMRGYYAGGIGDSLVEKQGRIHIYDIYANYLTNLVETEQDVKKEILQEQLRKRFAAHSFLLEEGDVRATVEMDSILIHKRLVVTIEADYSLPFYSSSSVITAESVISGQTELIRNVDLAVDLVNAYLPGVSQAYDKVIEKLVELLEKVDRTK